MEPNQLKLHQTAFGYTKEDISFFLNPMLKSGVEPTGSMGTDTPISLLCNQTKLLYSYFKQCFAQVTNPPIDPIREEDLKKAIDSSGQILEVKEEFVEQDDKYLYNLDYNHSYEKLF